MMFLCIMIILTLACLKFKLACLRICATIVNKTLLEKIIENIRWNFPSSANFCKCAWLTFIYCIFGGCDFQKKYTSAILVKQYTLKDVYYNWVTLLFDQSWARVVYSAEKFNNAIMFNCHVDIKTRFLHGRHFRIVIQVKKLCKATRVLGEIIAFLHRLG